MRHTLHVFLLVGFLILSGCTSSSQETAPAEQAASAPATDTASAYFIPDAPPVFDVDGLRVATLNVEFMFDGLGDEGQADFPHKGDPALARAHRDRIARILRMLDADVVMLAEIEHAEAMQLLVDESLADLGYRVYFSQGEDSFTGQDMGLLSRLPIESVGRTDARVAVVGEADRMQGVSKNMWARMDLAGIPTTLVGVHFYSRPTDEGRKERREAQAEVIRRFVAAEQATGRAVVVLGDFNDYDEATPDVSGHTPITDVLARLKAAGDGAANDLRNVLAEVPEEDRFTAHWDRNRNMVIEEGEFSAIDHILLSPRLYERLLAVHYVHAHDPLDTPDHFPLVVTLGVN